MLLRLQVPRRPEHMFRVALPSLTRGHFRKWKVVLLVIDHSRIDFQRARLWGPCSFSVFGGVVGEQWGELSVQLIPALG